MSNKKTACKTDIYNVHPSSYWGKILKLKADNLDLPMKRINMNKDIKCRYWKFQYIWIIKLKSPDLEIMFVLNTLKTADNRLSCNDIWIIIPYILKVTPALYHLSQNYVTHVKRDVLFYYASLEVQVFKATVGKYQDWPDRFKAEFKGLHFSFQHTPMENIFKITFHWIWHNINQPCSD